MQMISPAHYTVPHRLRSTSVSGFELSSKEELSPRVSTEKLRVVKDKRDYFLDSFYRSCVEQSRAGGDILFWQSEAGCVDQNKPVDFVRVGQRKGSSNPS